MNESDLDDENPTGLKLTEVAGASKSLEIYQTRQTASKENTQTYRTDPKYKFPLRPKHTSSTVPKGIGKMETE